MGQSSVLTREVEGQNVLSIDEATFEDLDSVQTLMRIYLISAILQSRRDIRSLVFLKEIKQQQHMKRHTNANCIILRHHTIAELNHRTNPARLPDFLPTSLRFS